MDMEQSTKSSIFNRSNQILNEIQNSLDVIISKVENFLRPTLKFGFTTIVNSFSPFMPVKNADLIIGVLFRTFLILPIIWLLKNNCNLYACLFVLCHEFLSSVIISGDPKNKLFTSFYEICFEKIENIFNLLIIMQCLSFNNVCYFTTILYFLFYYTLIAYDSLIAVISVQNYFDVMTKLEASLKVEQIKNIKNIKEEKLKSKLQSFGIVFLCLAFRPSSSMLLVAFELLGFFFLALVIRISNEILVKQLSTVKRIRVNVLQRKNQSVEFYNDDDDLFQSKRKNAKNLETSQLNNQRARTRSSGGREKNPDTVQSDDEMETITNRDIESEQQQKAVNAAKLKRSYSMREKKENHRNVFYNKTFLEQNNPDNLRAADIEEEGNQKVVVSIQKPIDIRADRVYTVGCFDLFHYGHIKLFERMSSMGRKLIVGVHDSRSIFKLKKRVPVDSTETRMLNVKKFANEVFCIAGTDPSNFIECIVSLYSNETAIYVRGDDMPNFPGRKVVEKYMTVVLLPYTEGISSTEIRKQKYSHIKPDDKDYLDRIN